MDEGPLTEDDAALVLRRAAELSAPLELGDGLRRGLDRAALEEAAAEVGIEPAAVRHALAELDAGALQPVAAGSIAVRRVIERPLAEVDTDVRLLLRRELFQIRRDTGTRSVWVRRDALAARAVRLANRLTGHLRLTAIRAVEVTAVAVDDSATLVQLLVDTRFYRHRQTGEMAGSATVGAASVAAGVSVLGIHPLGLAVAGGGAVLGALGCMGAAAAYRGHVGDAEDAAEGLLDELAKGAPRPTWRARPMRPMSSWRGVRHI